MKRSTQLVPLTSLSEVLNVEQTTLWRWAKRNSAIVKIRIGRTIAVDPKNVERELAKLQAAGKSLGRKYKEVTV